MNVKIGKITHQHCQEIALFIRNNNIPAEDDVQGAAYVEIMIKLLNKLQNKLFNASRKFNFSLSATEAWALRKLYYSTGNTVASYTYIYPLVEIIERQCKFINTTIFKN